MSFRCSARLAARSLAFVLLLTAGSARAGGSAPPPTLEHHRRRLSSADHAERAAAYEALHAAGEQGRTALRDALLQIRGNLVARCRGFALPEARQNELLNSHNLLAAARRRALEVIFDKSAYRNTRRGRAGQQAVDRAVADVKTLHAAHRRAFLPALEAFAPVAEAHARIREIDQQLGRCDDARLFEFPRTLAEIIGPRLKPELIEALLREASFRRDVSRCLRYNREVRTSLSRVERKVVDLTNDYRIQLGIHPLAVNELLVRAARKHSIEMKALGYFDHYSPVPANRHFQVRCHREGYRWVNSENLCSNGGPDFAFRSWRRSPAHHRNLLDARHTEIGVGCAGPWTVDFGASKTLDLDHPRSDGPSRNTPSSRDHRGSWRVALVCSGRVRYAGIEGGRSSSSGSERKKPT